MRDKFLHATRQRQPLSTGTSGLLVSLSIALVVFNFYHLRRVGVSLADMTPVVALVALIVSRQRILHRDIVSSTVQPILLAIYGYMVVALLPTLSGGGFMWLQFAKDVFSFSLLPITYVTIARVVNPRRIRLAIQIGLTFSIALVAFSVFSVSAVRAGGIFKSPNLCGNWAACTVFLLLVLELPKNVALRIGISIVLIVIAIESASLGGILCLIGTAAYFFPRKFGKVSLANQLLPILTIFVAPFLLQLFDSWSGLNRYQRSSQGRLSIWGDAVQTWFRNPLGLGIGNFNDRNLELAVAPEAHNDYVSSLVEMGILGPLAIGFICFAIYRVSGLRTRSIVVFYLISAVSHNSINFRHIWIYAAICLAYDTLPQLQPGYKEDDEQHGNKPQRRRRWPALNTAR